MTKILREQIVLDTDGTSVLTGVYFQFVTFELYTFMAEWTKPAVFITRSVLCNALCGVVLVSIGE